MKTDEKERQALIQALLSELTSPEPLHLDYELIERYTDGGCDAIDREIVESHIEMCAMCGREVRDLETFSKKVGRHGRTWWPLAVAAVAAGLLITILPLFRPSGAAVSLHDGSRDVRLSRAGELSGISGLTVGEQQRIAIALRTGVIALPESSVRLARSGDSLRSTYPVSSPRFEPLAPIGCIIVTDRPIFEWNAIRGARYRVEVFSDHFRPVADSGSIDANRWTVPVPLQRGATYVWQVTAISNGSEVTVPAPPAPEARFAILDANEASTIAHLEQLRPRSHLALGVAYAHAGVMSEAERELTALADENPGSAEAQRLLQSLHSH